MQRFYGVTKPLRLTWRRFRVLMDNMPSDSVFYARVSAETNEPPVVSDAMRQIDERLGRQYTEVRRRSIDDLIGSG